MGSSRSPHPSPLDPHSPYTQSPSTSKRKSSKSSSRTSYDRDYDQSHNNYDQGHSHYSHHQEYDYDQDINVYSDRDDSGHRRHSSSSSSKKKKKNKREREQERERERERERDRFYERSDSDVDVEQQSNSTTTAATPSSSSTPKLPPIKISLRLPALSTISNLPTSSSSTKGPSRKKIRTSYYSDEDQDRSREHVPEISGGESDEPSPSSRKKKKKKHKHKHRHSHHEEEYVDVQDHPSPHRYENSNQSTAPPAADEDQEEYAEPHIDIDGAGTRRSSSTSKFKIRLGKTGKDTPGNERRQSKKAHRNHPSDETQSALHSSQDQNPYPISQESFPSNTAPQTLSKSTSSSSATSQGYHPLSLQEGHQGGQYPTQPNLPPAPSSPTPPPPAPASSSIPPATTHTPVGQKKPYAAIQSQQSDHHGMGDEANANGDDHDDPLAGELDELEDYDEEDDDEDEEAEDNDRQSGDENETMSPSTPNGSHHGQFGSKTVRSGYTGSKTVPRAMSASSQSVTDTPKSKASKDQSSTREGSVTASSSTNVKGGKRKGKTPKRLSSPRTTTPAAPKKKELSAVCHKLLDQFIKKDVYVLFTEPVDPVLVPDYSTVIKNPMDLSTMRAKVERNFYPTIDEFLSDFQLVCDNARLYNAKDTLYWKQADKLWEWGSKAIERDRKTIMDKEEETLKTVKDEETLDIVGMGDHTLGAQMNRGSILSIDKGVDSPMSIPETGRPHTPQQYRKSKKIKHRRDGTIALSYATDGSIDPASHPDPWSLVPAGPEFGAQPIVTPISRATSGDYNGSYLDDYPYDAIFRSTSRPSQFQDFGPFALLDTPQNNGNTSGLEQIPAYTGMIFGDARGEALVRSLVRFMEPIVSSQDSEAGTIEPGQQLVQEFIRAKIEKLTRGASTIVDKVAAVVREEKFGQPTGVDTRVPLSLWNQGSLKAKDLKTEKDVKKEPVDSEMPLAQQDHVTDAKPAEGDQMAVDVVSDDSKVEGSGSSNVPDKDVEMTSKDEEGPKVEEGPKDEVASKDVAALKDEASPNSIRDSSKEESMIDIRKVIQDIKAWPLIQRKRADYQAWKQLKIELDSLLPASRRVTEPAAAPPAEPPAGEDDIIEVMWGVKWTGGDSEESKRWVREYLETNSKEMLQIVQILAEKSPRSASATATSLNGSDGSVSAPSATASLTDSERELVETTTKNIRKRLVEMAQYVPLSEINPKHLPLPKAPPPAAASASASASTPAPAPVSADPTPTTTTASESVNTSTQSTAAPAAPSSTAPLAEPPATVTTTPATPTTPAPAVETTVPPSSSNTTTATTATPLQRSYVPSDGSASSLSSPGSSP